MRSDSAAMVSVGFEVPSVGTLPDTFRAVIDGHASTQPTEPFLIAPEPGIAIDYATLRANCVAFAGLLRGQGIAPGATVSFMLENGLSAATVFLGAMYGGCSAQRTTPSSTGLCPPSHDPGGMRERPRRGA